MRKLGVQPLWLRDGTRVVTTLFQVHNCHVVKYIPKHEHNGHSACVIVGCGNGVPYLKDWLKLFKSKILSAEKSSNQFLSNKRTKITLSIALMQV